MRHKDDKQSDEKTGTQSKATYHEHLAIRVQLTPETLSTRILNTPQQVVNFRREIGGKEGKKGT